MNVHVLGVGQLAPVMHSPLRLEEMAYAASSEALRSAGVSRGELDHITIAACDEFDGRPISSMLMTAPAGGYMTDEIKVTDNGLMGLALGYARIASGDFDLGLVASWCKSSKTDQTAVMRMRADPFFLRPLGMDGGIADALFAQAVAARHGLTQRQAAVQVAKAYQRAQANPRGLRHAVPRPEDVETSDYQAVPLRTAHMPPATDGAVSLVLASGRYLKQRPHLKPLCRIAGVGWCSDSYTLGAERLGSLRSLRTAWSQTMQSTGLDGSEAIDLVELDTPTIFHELAFEHALGLDPRQVSPSGGSFAQNPLFCNGLVNAMEAVLQASGRAGPVQKAGARRSAAHGCHGYAQQGHVFAIFEQEISA